jgi:peroxisomal 3,2-trans-enoyl-CoA isomerase
MNSGPESRATLVVKTITDDGIATLRFNNPDKLNAWSNAMRETFRVALADARSDASVRAVIVTGTGKYYSAGVDFAGAMRPMHPRAIREVIRSSNYALFDQFIDFPKPIFAAVNGPAIGAAVTSASLTDGIVASPSATFYTPFKTLGVVPEGCSSYYFPRLMGEANARRFLEDGEKVTAAAAAELGLVAEVVPPEELMAAAERHARDWLDQGKERGIVAEGIVERLKEVNAAESVALADAICDYPFLDSMIRFTRAKKKWGPLAMFGVLRLTRPIWSRL